MEVIDKIFGRKIYKGDVVYLKKKYFVDEKSAYDGVATVYYDIYRNEDNKKIGSTDLRLTIEGFMYYFGHIGYRIEEKYRGHNYSYYSTKLLFEIAYKEYGIKEIILTCSPENTASCKVLQKLGGEFVELVNVPKGHELYRLGETRKYVYKYKLNF